MEQYLIPKVEDLFAQLAGGQKFSKLDMSHAYQQIMLDESANKYVTVNTHFWSILRNLEEVLRRLETSG